MKDKKFKVVFLSFLLITLITMGYATSLVHENNAQLQGYVDNRIDSIKEKIKQPERANKQLYKATCDDETFYFQTADNPFKVAESYVGECEKLVIERSELLDEDNWFCI